MTRFIWDPAKEAENIAKHGVDFKTAEKAFLDPELHIAVDTLHSRDERRYFCIGKVEGRVLTVRFTYRGDWVRIIGAGLWRKGKRFYEKKKKRN